MNNLPEIRDIHIPDGVSMFPLAYGWWIILIILILAILAIKIILWTIKKSRKYYTKRVLEKIDTTAPISAAIQISELLRRVSNLKYPEARALYGKQWIEFLNTHCSTQISGKTAELLSSAPFMDYRNTLYSTKDTDTLKHFANIWIGENL